MENLTGWWIAWIVTGAVVVVVAILVVSITATARKIASIAMEGDRSLEIVRDRTTVLWTMATTNRVAETIFEAAVTARRGLGGEVGDEAQVERAVKTPEEIVGAGVKTAQDAVKDVLPAGPQTDPEHGRA